jgi:hypothetical protein
MGDLDSSSPATSWDGWMPYLVVILSCGATCAVVAKYRILQRLRASIPPFTLLLYTRSNEGRSSLPQSTEEVKLPLLDISDTFSTELSFTSLLWTKASSCAEPIRVISAGLRMIISLGLVRVWLPLLSSFSLLALYFLLNPMHHSQATDSYQHKWPVLPNRILIFQHTVSMLDYPDVIKASISGHERYAQTHGYRYALNNLSYTDSPDSVGAGSMNKLWSLREIVQSEVNKGESGCECIWSVAVPHVRNLS